MPSRGCSVHKGVFQRSLVHAALMEQKIIIIETQSVIRELFKEIRMSASVDSGGGLIARRSSLQHDGFVVFGLI